MENHQLINADSGKKFSIILCDPPWTYRDKCHSGERGAGYKYSTMTVPELCALPVASIAADDCLLAMWHVAPMPEEAISVVKAWGFKLKTMKGFCWHKLTKNGKSHFGMGNYTRANTEDCLFAIKGRPKRMDAGVRQFVEAQVREHSRKPDEVRDRLVRLMGDVPRVELFARAKVPGWLAWGDQIESDIEL